MRVLVCPLDWGLGHATRCIPLIRALVRNGHQVVIGAAGGGLRLLRAEFPDLESVDFPGYPVRYSAGAASLLPVLMAQLPGLFLSMARERRLAARLVADLGIDLVISDGRYGVRSRRVPSIFVTHQLAIRPPGRLPGVALAARLLLALNRKVLGGFRALWIPDFPGEPNLSGDLSHGAYGFPKAEFIGPLCRFNPPEGKPRGLPVVDILASVSGPEPQRTLFEKSLREVLGRHSGTRVLVRGLPGPGPVGSASAAEPVRLEPGNLNVLDHLDGSLLGPLFSAATLVVARPGYTTVMEMAGLGIRQAVLVPTPGQSEQEYLADHLDRSGIALRMDQDELDLSEAQRRLGRYKGFAGFLGKRGSPVATLEDFIAGHPLFADRTGGGSAR